MNEDTSVGSATPTSESSPDFDAERFKAMERAGFNRIATRYAQGAHSRRVIAEALLAAADLAPGQSVLDLASGPALLAAAAAQRVLPGGRLVASDLAETMLLAAQRQLASEKGRHDALLFAAADAEQLCFTDGSFDRVLAGLALFMFPDPLRALRESARTLRPRGRIALSVWGRAEHVPLITVAQTAIARVLGSPKVKRPSVFRFGDPTDLEQLLAEAGFDDIRIEPVAFTCDFFDAAAYWQGFLDLAGGVNQALANQPKHVLDQILTAIDEALDAYRASPDAEPRLAARAWIASAGKPERCWSPRV